MHSTKQTDSYIYSCAPRPLVYACEMASVKYEINPNLGLPLFLKIDKWHSFSNRVEEFYMICNLCIN